MRFLLLLLLLFEANILAIASNGCNNTLINIVPFNEYAIIGEVQEIKTSGTFPDSGLTLSVSVNQVLKGTLTTDHVEIEISQYFFSNYSLENGFLTFMFFFNSKNENDTEFYLSVPCAWFHLSGDYQPMLDKTIELIAIHEIRNKRTRVCAMIDWSISCMEEKGMVKGQGMVMFFNPGPLYFRDERNNKYRRKIKYLLKPNQRRSIVNYFLSRESLSWGDLRLLPLIKLGNKKAVYAKMVERLKAYDAAKFPWMVEFNLMREIVAMNHDEELSDIINKIDEIGVYSHSEELRTLTNLFISKM